MVLGRYPEFGYRWDEEEIFDSEDRPKGADGVTHSGPEAGYSSSKPPKLTPAQFMRIVSVGLQRPEASQASQGEESANNEAFDVLDNVRDVLSTIGELIEKGFTYDQVGTLMERTSNREIWDTIAYKTEEMSEFNISKDLQISQAAIDLIALNPDVVHIATRMLDSMELARTS